MGTALPQLDRVAALADTYADLDRSIWGDDDDKAGSPDPAADMMQTARELAQLMGETVRMINEQFEALNKRLDEIEDAISKQAQPIVRPQ